MKKILLTMIAVASLGLVTKAQTFGFKKGDVMLEGAFSVNSSDNKNSETKQNSFALSPKVGFFVSDKAAFGVRFTYSENKNTNYSGSNDSYTKSNSVGGGIFGRYYFLEAGSRFKVYGEGDLGYTSAGGETSLGSTTVKLDKTNSFGFNGGIGANFFLTEKVAIGYQFADIIGYSSSKVDANGAKASNNFYVNLNSFGNFFNTGQFSLTFKL